METRVQKSLQDPSRYGLHPSDNEVQHFFNHAKPISVAHYTSETAWGMHKVMADIVGGG